MMEQQDPAEGIPDEVGVFFVLQMHNAVEQGWRRKYPL
jgi:hypothetical protein